MIKDSDHCKAEEVFYLNIQNVFAKVPCNPVFFKVLALEIMGVVARWIEIWLKRGKQRVVFNNAALELAPISARLSQESI